jgi:hypothetical protein
MCLFKDDKYAGSVLAPRRIINTITNTRLIIVSIYHRNGRDTPPFENLFDQNRLSDLHQIQQGSYDWSRQPLWRHQHTPRRSSWSACVQRPGFTSV